MTARRASDEKAKSEVNLDVAVIGAGPAGLGCALALQACGVERMAIFDRSEVGASFARWPRQMRLITPSFHSNPFRQPDLNAITPKTSPADFLHGEHPTGREYALYLKAVATHYALPVREGTGVEEIKTSRAGFDVITSNGVVRARNVIWAAGEFSRPDHGGIKGAHHCRHNGEVADWKLLRGGEYTIIGGYESGIDAAVNLAWLGKNVKVLSRGEPWHVSSPDPSVALSPYTIDRLKAALLEAPGSIHFYKNADISEVTRQRGRWRVHDRAGGVYESETAPILCTGFHTALLPVRHLFHEAEGQLIFSEEADESTLTPGLFYSGPSLVHRGSSFCFIYKFRSRFGVVARAIAQRLGLRWEAALRPWQDHGFMLEDLSCCVDCQCAVAATEEREVPPVAEYETLNGREVPAHV